jgi:YVTN family beta-propeller protein
LAVFNPCTPIQGASQAAGQAHPKETLTSEILVFSFWEESTNLQFDPNFPTQMLVVNSASDNVGILDTTTDEELATIPVGTTPEQNAFDTELPQAVVTNLGSDNVTLVNTETASTAFVPVGDAPTDVVFNIQTSSNASPVLQEVLGNPQPDSFQSGIGVISGFVCDASQILIEFNGTATFEAAYGTSRGDTQDICGDSNNGFSLLFNWNLLGNGTHTVRALADSVEFANVTITVTTLGAEFRTDLSGTVPVPDFPMPGQTTNLRWQQGQQNFVIFSGAGGGGGSTGDAQRMLENPPPGSFQSGVSVISGFVCTANQILIEFDGAASFEAAYGTSRGDTASVCGGDANNGFSLLFNWNLLGNGVHTVRAFADGVMFAEVTITVTTLGGEFLTGLSGAVTVPDFPEAGQTTSLRWQQSQQNFVIDGLF